MVSLRISRLTHAFDGREVFRSVDFAFDGGCLAVTGPNGSGKSTLLRIIAGLLTPSAGTAAVSLDGVCLTGGALRNAIGLAAPDVSLYADLTARENLRFLANARSLSSPKERVSRVLESVGLAERADDPLSELSSGLRRRAELAAALIHEPLLLLLDEPFSNLDPEGVEMLGSIVENQKLRGMALVATSDPAEARIGEQCLDLRRMHEER